jgi:hypothetical protein
MNNFKKTLAILTLATVIFAMFPTYGLIATEPHNANAMWIEPSTIELNATEISVGYRFNVTFWANSSLETKGWQFWLVYANAYINATQVGYTAESKSEFFQNITTLPVTPAFIENYNATHNRLDFGEAWVMGPKRGPGYGSLCWVEFEVVALPPANQAVDIPLDIKWAYDQFEPPKTYLLYADGTSRPLNVYNGLVKFVGEVPPTPTYTLYITVTTGGTTNPTPGAHVYFEGQEVSVQAIPNSGYMLDHWELDSVNIGAPNPANVTMNADHNLHAVFSRIPPPAGTRIFVDPPEIIDPTMLPSSTFSINITVDDVADLKTCIFNLTYNPEIIGWIGMRLFKVQGQFPIPILTIDDEIGFIWMKLSYQTSFATLDPTSLVGIEFHVDALGATPLDLHDTYLLDSEDQPMNHNVTDGFFMSLIRDVAVTNIYASQNWAYQGWTVNIYVTVKNKGNVSETFNARAYYDSNLIGTITVTNLVPNEERTITFVWTTTGVAEGNYTINAEAETVPYEFNTSDNTLTDGIVWIMTQIHDVAIINVTSANWAYQGWIIDITVTVKNAGEITETFSVEAYYDSNLIGNATVENLPPGEQMPLVFYWNTSTVPACQNYTLSAEIPPIPYEFNTTNNQYIDGKVKIRVYGDVTGDGHVGIDDIVMTAEAFGSTPDHPRWNPYGDLTRDNYVGIDDIVIVAANFGAHC